MPEDTKENTEQETVEITETIDVAEPTAFATDGLLPQEVEMAKEHGLVKEPKDDKEVKEEKDEQQKQPETEAEDNKDEVKPTFEQVEIDEDSLKKYNKNEQALYWKYKSDKKKRQRAQKDLEEYKATYDLGTLKERNKIKKISEALSNKDITVEALQEIIGGTTEKADDAPVTRSDLKELKAEEDRENKKLSDAEEERKERIETAENVGYSKYGKEEFEELTRLTTEYVNTPAGKTYKKLLETSFNDTDVSEDVIADQVATIAKLNPNFGKKKEEVKEEPKKEETEADRAIKNSKKKISSAAVASSSSKRRISEDDLTPDTAETLSPSQWSKLKPSTRKRLLQS